MELVANINIAEIKIQDKNMSFECIAIGLNGLN